MPISKNQFWTKGPIISLRARGLKPKPFRISTFHGSDLCGMNILLVLTAFVFSMLQTPFFRLRF